jgi:hypothetical protein
MPFLAEKVVHMLISVIKKGGGVDNEEDTPAMNKALG